MSEQVLEGGGRSVWQVMASYGIGAWVVLQVADTLSSLVGLPLWFGRALISVLVAGFVLLLVTSLVQRRGAGRVADGVAGFFTWKNTGRIGGAAFGLMVLATAVYLGMRAVGVGPVGTLQARGVFEEQERLILADFDGDVEQPGLAETVTTLLRIDLAQSRALTVMEPVQLEPVLRRMQRDPSEPVGYEVALEAARREGVKAVVAGELLQAGSAVVVSARIVAVSTGEVLVAVRETASDLAEIPERVDRLSAQLRERIGESLRSIQGDEPLEEVTTGSLQALEKYAQADRANNLGDTRRALSLMEEAVAEDSTFAMAHRKIGILLTNSGFEVERAQEAFSRAYALREQLTDRERWLAEAAYLQYVEGDEQGSIDRYETLLEAYPTDRIALNNLALAYRTLGRIEDAARLFLRSIEEGGAPATTYDGVIPLLYSMGDSARVRTTLDDFERTHPAHPQVGLWRVLLVSASFDYAAAEAAALALVEQSRGTPGAGAAMLTLANAQLVQGRVATAWETFERGLELLQEYGFATGISAGAAEALVAGGVVASFQDRPDEAVRVMDELRTRYDVSSDPVGVRQDPSFAVTYAFAGRPDRARALLADHAREASDDGAPLLRAEGAIAAAEGRFEEGVRLLHESRAANRECQLCGLAELGRVFDMASRPDSAIHYLERYLSIADLNRLANGDNITFWYVVPRLAGLHAERSDRDRARELYRLFLRATEAAEPDYQAKRERARAAVEALGG